MVQHKQSETDPCERLHMTGQGSELVIWWSGDLVI